MSRVLLFLSTLLLSPLLLGSGHDVSTSPTSQSFPIVISNGLGYSVAWLEQSGQARGTRVARVDRQGEGLDGVGALLTTDPAYSLAGAAGSNESLTAWIANGKVFAARSTRSGMIIDATPLIVSQDFAGEVAVAWDGVRYFVLWTSGSRLTGAFVGSNGTVSAPRRILDRGLLVSRPLFPDVTWRGHDFLISFAEAPQSGIICGTLCEPPPDHVSILRVSAAGETIDPAPIQIPGVHTRAHVASSGVESLVVMDDNSAVSAMVVHEENGDLHLDPEVRLFHWWYPAVSDVVWDGSSYTVAWQYLASPLQYGWLARTRVDRSGVASQTSFTATGQRETTSSSAAGGLSVATNDVGEVAFVIAELPPSSIQPKARLYLSSELQPLPGPPPPPRNAVSYFGGTEPTRIDWQADGADGFLVEESLDFGRSWFWYETLPGVARTTWVYARAGNLFRVSALGPGGVSSGTITSIGSQRRQRPAAH